MDIVSRVREMAQPLARAEGVELLNVTFVKEGQHRVLRLTIERDQGPTSVADCETISRAVGAALDASDFIPHQYMLEVSSAGLTRPLCTLPDFKRNVGRLVKVALRHDRSGPLVGTLAAADESGLMLVLADGSRRSLALPEIASARREIMFNVGRGEREDPKADGGEGEARVRGQRT